jgi:hypothetical protein
VNMTSMGNFADREGKDVNAEREMNMQNAI